MRPEQTFDDLDVRQCAPKAGTDVLLWGAAVAHYYSGLTKPLHDRGIELAQMTASSCAANLGLDIPTRDLDPRPNCKSFNDAAFRLLMSAKPKVVILEAQENPEFDGMLGKITDAGIRVVLLGLPPTYREPVPIILERRIKAGSSLEWSDVSVLRSELFEKDRVLSSHFANVHAVRYVSILGEGCPDARCRMSINNIPLHFDTGHFTRQGSDHYSRLLIDALDQELSIAKSTLADASHVLR